jgi:Holliday junction DNA helicase RuvA
MKKMIVRITGKLAGINTDNVILDRDGVCYEVHMPASAIYTLSGKLGQTITLYTIEYYEGTAVGGNLFPRLVGFIEPDDRAFFMEFVKVKGLGYRKTLRALAQPIADIASAIEQGDVRFLAKLPEIGKRTADQLVASLHGKLGRYTVARGEMPMGEGETENLDQLQREALEVLMQLGEKRIEAVELIQKVCKADAGLDDPGKIVEAVYRRKAGTI